VLWLLIAAPMQRPKTLRSINPCTHLHRRAGRRDEGAVRVYVYVYASLLC
jgi:hypothetical protein